MENYKFEKNLKKRVLMDKCLEYSEVAQAVQNIITKGKQWCKPENYINHIGSGAASISTHISKIFPLVESVEDLQNILTEHTSDKFAKERYINGENAVNSLQGSLEALNNYEQQSLTPFYNQLENLYSITNDFLKNEQNYLPIPEGDTIWNNYQSRFTLLKNEMTDELKSHPAYEWLDQAIEQVERIRKTIRQNLQDFHEILKLDNELGWIGSPDRSNSTLNLSNPTVQRFHDYQANQIAEFSLYHWGLSLWDEMNQLDNEDKTGWCSNLFVELGKPKESLNEYLREEVKSIDSIRKTDELAVDNQFPDIPQKYCEYILSAKYDEAQDLFIEWLGILPESANDFLENFDQLKKSIERLDSWENIINFLNSDSYSIVIQSSKTMFEWLTSMVEIISAVAKPSDKACRWHKDRFAYFERYKDFCVAVFGYADSILKKMGERQQTWEIEYNKLGNYVVDYIDVDKSVFKSKKWKEDKRDHILSKELIPTLCICQELAPNNLDIINKVKTFGNCLDKVPENCSELAQKPQLGNIGK